MLIGSTVAVSAAKILSSRSCHPDMALYCFYWRPLVCRWPAGCQRHSIESHQIELAPRFLSRRSILSRSQLETSYCASSFTDWPTWLFRTSGHWTVRTVRDSIATGWSGKDTEVCFVSKGQSSTWTFEILKLGSTLRSTNWTQRALRMPVRISWILTAAVTTGQKFI